MTDEQREKWLDRLNSLMDRVRELKSDASREFQPSTGTHYLVNGLAGIEDYVFGVSGAVGFHPTKADVEKSEQAEMEI